MADRCEDVPVKRFWGGRRAVARGQGVEALQQQVAAHGGQLAIRAIASLVLNPLAILAKPCPCS